MLIKEYRIPMPLTVEEYRIAQLYMIQKKSRQESEGEGSGVEILVNEPYTNQNVDGTTTSGQYTYKVYHIGKHLPSWFRSMIPQSAQRVEEEAWNAYPYTKTRYTCPFMEKFFIEIETKYFADPGTQDNVFGLAPDELRQRTVEYIDIVKDSLLGSESDPSNDPAKYVSLKSARGPLTKNWLKEWAKDRPRSLMCAYKLCRIDFRYWGMQSKVEKFINDIALRKTMISAHQQAWCWQDEWIGLDMDDIRRLESEAQAALALKMKSHEGMAGTTAADAHRGYESDDGPDDDEGGPSVGSRKRSSSSTGERIKSSLRASLHSITNFPRSSHTSNTTAMPGNHTGSRDYGKSSINTHVTSSSSLLELLETHDSEDEYLTPEIAYNDAPVSEKNKSSNFGNSVTSRMDSFPETEDSDIVTYFDAQDDQSNQGSWRNYDIERGTGNRYDKSPDRTIRVQSPGGKEKLPSPSSTTPSKTLALFIVIHGGNFLDSYGSPQAFPRFPAVLPIVHKDSVTSCTATTLAEGLREEGFEMRLNDINTFKASVRKVLKEKYPQLTGRIAFKHVVIRDIYSEVLQLLTSLSPMGYLKLLDGLHHATIPPIGFEPWGRANWAGTECGIPLSAIPLLACPDPANPNSSQYRDLMVKPAQSLLNEAFHEFMEQEPDFKGQICLVADMAGSVVAYDTLKLFSSPSEPTGDPENSGLAFVPRHFFTMGSPLGLILAQRNSKFINNDPKNACQETGAEDYAAAHIVPRLGPERSTKLCQIYNLFYQVDPFGSRIEPLLNPSFGLVAPCPADGSFNPTNGLIGAHRSSPSYLNQQPGDSHLVKCIQKNSHLFATAPFTSRKQSGNVSLTGPLNNTLSTADITEVLDSWWGTKRVDYVLRKCPSGLGNHFPISILPHIFHAGYWQSRHVARFIMGQVFSDYKATTSMGGIDGTGDGTCQKYTGLSSAPPSATDTHRSSLSISPGSSPHFRDKWRRTKSSFVQTRNISSNHRANDVIINDSMPQTLVARFSYGPLDVITVGGQMVDIYVYNDDVMSPRASFAIPRKSLSTEYLGNDLIPGTGQDDSTSIDTFCLDNYNSDDTQWKYLGSAQTHRDGRLQFTLRDVDRLSNGLHQIRMVVRTNGSSLHFDLAILPRGTECVVFSIDGSFTASVSLTGKDPKIRPGCLDVVRHWVSLGYFVIYISARPNVQMNTVVSWMCHHNFPWGFIYFVDHLSADSLKNKANYLKYLALDVGLKIHSAYGSSKDIPIYNSLGLPPDRIFALGKIPKKFAHEATTLYDGYVPHLMLLKSIGGSIPATGPGRIYHKKESLITHDLSKHKFSLSPFEGGNGPPSSEPVGDSSSTRGSFRDRFWGLKSRSPVVVAGQQNAFSFSSPRNPAGGSARDRRPRSAMEKEAVSQDLCTADKSATNKNYASASSLQRGGGGGGDRKHSLGRLFKR